jgi:hypothetical protein
VTVTAAQVTGHTAPVSPSARRLIAAAAGLAGAATLAAPGPFKADFTGGSQPPKIRSQARAAALPSSSGQNLAANAA